MVHDLKIHLEIIEKKILSTSYINAKNISALTGCASRLIFLSNLIEYQSKNKEQYKSIIKNDVITMLDYVKNKKTSQTNIDGLAGFGWTLSYLCSRNHLDEDENKLLFELDEHLFQLAREDIENNNFDFFYGAIGYGNYFINRSEANKDCRVYLKKIGNSLLTPKTDLTSTLKKETSDFSLSHGLSSQITFLSQLISMNINVNEFRDRIKIGCEQILSYERSNRLPDAIEEGKSIYSPLRWCHGELGIVSALAFAAKILDDNDINKKAFKVANEIALYRLDTNQKLNSATICHGTLGIAHIFQKWHNNYWKSEEIKQASNYWYIKSNEIMNSKTKYNFLNNEGIYREQQGILYGIEGIGLALISALDSNVKEWESSILLY